MTQVPMWATFRPIDERAGSRSEELPLLSVSQYRGVIPRAEIDDAEARAQDLGIYKTCLRGDLVLNRMSAYKGAVGVSPMAGLVSPDYLVMRPTNIAMAEFLAFLIKTPWFVGRMTSLVRGIGSVDGSNVRTPRIGIAELGSIKIDLPSLEDQLRIVRSLDRETAEINAFVADQEKLIRFLTERRAATISHAVTKGLDPAAPMKDSGIEWVGDIPIHWTRARMKNFGTIRYGIGEPPRYVDIGVPLIRATNVSEGRISDHRMALVDPADIPMSRIVWLQEGDIVVVRSGALTADSAIIPRQYDQAIAGFDMVFRAKREVNSMFIQYALLSSYLKKAQLEVASSRAAQPHLNAQELGDARVVVPPFEEQQRIVVWLNHEILQLDAAIADARESIALSRERRAALISAAVTGKIDVREHAHSKS